MAVGAVGADQSKYPSEQDKRTPPPREIRATVFREREAMARDRDDREKREQK